MSASGKRIVASLGMILGISVSTWAQAPDAFGPPPASAPPRASLRLASPMPTPPPMNTPPLRLGSLSPVATAPVMPAAPSPATFPRDGMVEAAAPELQRQSAVFRAEPHTAPVATDETSDDPEQDWKPGATLAEAVQSGQQRMKNTAKGVGRTRDFVLGIKRCPDCGKRRPAYNRYRVGVVRTRDFLLTGQGEEKVAMSPNAKPAS